MDKQVEGSGSPKSMLKKPSHISTPVLFEDEPSSQKNTTKENTEKITSGKATVIKSNRGRAYKNTHARTLFAGNRKEAVDESRVKRQRILAEQRTRMAEGPRPATKRGPAGMLADKKLLEKLSETEEITKAMEQKIGEAEEKLTAVNFKFIESTTKISILENEKTMLGKDLQTATEEIEQLSLKCSQTDAAFESYRKRNEELQRKLARVENEEIPEYRRTIATAASTETALRGEIEALNRRIVAERDEKEKINRVSEKNIHRTEESARTIAELEQAQYSLATRLEMNELAARKKNEEINTLLRNMDDKTQKLADAERRIAAGERLRRRLHNEVLELKGNIRVFCRLRPPADGAETGHIVLPPSEESSTIELRPAQDRTDISGHQKSFAFTFDRIFGQSDTQEMVFEEISQLVQSVLDGYPVCIFAYGQTGSGKTYTMEGPEGIYRDSAMNPQMGMIPRAVHQLFLAAEQAAVRGWAFEIEASFLEIYNESIRDLLSNSNTEEKHEIKHAGGNTAVTNLTTAAVGAYPDVIALLAGAARKRSFAATLCNERSSRSHTVFTLKVVGENKETTEKTAGVLNLIDLAGSERLSQSGSVGERLKETQAINKSLSSLGDVISALYSKEGHVPYRNSKLTYLLQNSLGGNSKTLMFANISPEISDMNESLCSLRFATKVNSCEIGTARKKHL
ncbi:MAG: kinesin-like protein [Amphiamblys sp. WSBS2006]|nr:MAG: kinesin-like protein [Amphiamblys sp. WSBS2006]